VFLHFVFLLVVAASALARVSALGTTAFVGVAFFVILSLVVLSALLEEKPGARALEFGRVLLLLALGGLYGPGILALILGYS
jgi:hypothetical protein